MWQSHSRGDLGSLPRRRGAAQGDITLQGKTSWGEWWHQDSAAAMNALVSRQVSWRLIFKCPGSLCGHSSLASPGLKKGWCLAERGPVVSKECHGWNRRPLIWGMQGRLSCYKLKGNKQDSSSQVELPGRWAWGPDEMHYLAEDASLGFCSKQRWTPLSTFKDRDVCINYSFSAQAFNPSGGIKPEGKVVLNGTKF